MITIAQNIKSIRKSREISQSDLAKKAGLQPSSISHFESGSREPSAANIIKLSKALGCTSDAILGLITDNYYQMRDQMVATEEKLRDALKVLNKHIPGRNK